MRHKQRNVMASGINNQFNIRRYFDCKFCAFLYYNFWLKCCYIISISSIDMLFDISSEFCLHLKYTLHRRNIKTWSLDKWVYQNRWEIRRRRGREKKNMNTSILFQNTRSMFSAIWNLCVWTPDYLCAVYLLNGNQTQTANKVKSLNVLRIIILFHWWNKMPQFSSGNNISNLLIIVSLTQSQMWD